MRDIEALKRIADPAGRLTMTAEEMDSTRQHHDKLVHLRADTIRELRACGWTYEQIGARLGVTKQRAAKMANPDLPRG